MKNLTMRNKKAELLAGAKELGIEVNNKMTKQEILILINTNVLLYINSLKHQIILYLLLAYIFYFLIQQVLLAGFSYFN